MKYMKLTCALCCVSYIGALSANSPPSPILTTLRTPLPLQSNQSLLNALVVIGAPMEAIMAFQISGEIGGGLTATFTRYANDSSNSSYKALTQDGSNALILFGYMLNTEGKISDAPMKTLMAKEKIRAGMKPAQIEELTKITKKIQKDPNFTLSDKQVKFISSILRYIDKNPFAFADTVGPLISVFLIDEDNPEKEDVAENIHDALTAAAESISGLSEEEIKALAYVTEDYNEKEEFTTSTENVAAVDQAMTVAFLPLGLYSLYPILGSDDVYVIDRVTRTHPAEFNTVYINRFNSQVARNRNITEVRRRNAARRRAHSPHAADAKAKARNRSLDRSRANTRQRARAR